MMEPRRTADEWIVEIETQIARERPFQAYDLWRQAQSDFPTHIDLALLGVMALLKGRSVRAARVARAGIAFDEDAASLQIRARAAEVTRLSWEIEGRPDDLAEAWRRYARLFAETADPVHGIQAALLAHRSQRPEEAREIARRLLDLDGGDHQMLRGHAALLLGDGPAAIECYRAATRSSADYHPVVEALRVVRTLRESGVEVPDEVAAILAPPTVVIFGGQPLDPPGLDEPLFPPHKERAVRDAIAAVLDEIDARIGYCSAACGSDLLFAEALLARGGDVHVILPCSLQDFVDARVAYAGPEWVERFHRVLAAAAEVRHATTERYLGHDALLRFGNDMIAGRGWIRADLLLTEPHLVATWDWRALPAPGSPADFIDHWADITRLHLVALDELPDGDGPAATPEAPRIHRLRPEREVNAMLFADVVGFSKLNEEHLPSFVRVLERVQERFTAAGVAPALVEAWGDALYVVIPSARDMLRCAFVLRQAFIDLDPDEFALPVRLAVRIGLHAGPVFPMVHPISRRPIYSGSQVNRAARIEPITMPGEVYASTEYVSLLTAEENAWRHEQRFKKAEYRPWYRWDYLGVLDLPKSFGQQAIYHLLPLARGGA